MFHGDEQDLDSMKIPSLQAEGRGWKGIVRKFGMDMYTLLYVKWITDKDLLYSIWNFQCHTAAWMGRESEEEWTHGYEWLSPFPVHRKLAQHCSLISYIPVQNKKLKKDPQPLHMMQYGNSFDIWHGHSPIRTSGISREYESTMKTWSSRPMASPSSHWPQAQNLCTLCTEILL